MLIVLMIVSIRLKHRSLIWTFHMLTSTPQLRLQFSLSTPKELMSSLLMTPIPTLRVTEISTILSRRNPSRLPPIIMRRIKLWRKGMKRPLSLSCSFLPWTCKLFCLFAKNVFLPFTLNVKHWPFTCYVFLFKFCIPYHVFVHSCVDLWFYIYKWSRSVLQWTL